MTYGVTPTGFVRPSVEDILADIESDQRSLISQTLDQDPDSPLGQINGIVARQLGMAWEATETSYNAFDADRAEDFLLTALGKLTGSLRDAATKSVVTLTVNLNSGTTLVAGEHFARVVGEPNKRFTPRTSFTAPSTGNHSVVFEAEVAGPVTAGSGTITVIATAVVGWNSVTNPNPATPGTVAEDDPRFRAKREAELARAGNQTFAAIKADLAALRHEGNQWVLSSEVFENTDNVTDGEGRPAHTFEVLVYTNTLTRPTNWKDQVAQVIWNNKPGGILPWGIASDNGNATNEKGETIVIPFSVVTPVPIFLSMVLTTVPGFASNATVRDTIVLEASEAYKQPGADVVALFVRALPFRVPGVLDVPTFTLGTAPAPVGTGNIAIGLRQVATFSTANISIS